MPANATAARPHLDWFAYVRIEAAEDLPSADVNVIDVVILDMNHGWPNIGHDSLVQAVREAGAQSRDLLRESGLKLRVLSFDLRQNLVIPESTGRFLLFLGTGGPGHLDPRQNNGTSGGTQGIVENISWEQPLFELFDWILSSEEASLIGVCHTFGVMCRWSGVAEPVLRGVEKGGKSAGIVANVLTGDGQSHPWFSRFASELPDGRSFRVLDSRLYDLIPVAGDHPAVPGLPLAFEQNLDGTVGEALTAIEFARDPGGLMPRVFAINHHPEIVDREHVITVLDHKLARNEVSEEWYHERADALTSLLHHPESERLVSLTSSYTLLEPLKFQVDRLIRRRLATITTPASAARLSTRGLVSVDV